jgi:hypothetical protein
MSWSSILMYTHPCLCSAYLQMYNIVFELTICWIVHCESVTKRLYTAHMRFN